MMIGLQDIHDVFVQTIEPLCVAPLKLRLDAKVETYFFPVWPNFLIEDDEGPIMAVMVMQGGEQSMAQMLGIATAWRLSAYRALLYVAWINHGNTLPHFEPLKQHGFIAGYQIMPFETLAVLPTPDLAFSHLRASIANALR